MVRALSGAPLRRPAPSIVLGQRSPPTLLLPSMSSIWKSARTLGGRHAAVTAPSSHRPLSRVEQRSALDSKLVTESGPGTERGHRYLVCPSILTVKSTIPSIIVIDGTSIILITLSDTVEIVRVPLLPFP